MAGFLNSMRNALLGDSYTDEDYDTEEEVLEDEPEVVPLNKYKKSNTSKIVNIHTNVQMEVVITAPEKVEDAGIVCDYIKSKKTVIVNLEGVMYENAQRITDFLSGACHALDGSIQRISNNIFIVAPMNVDLTGQFKEELKANGIVFPSWISSK